MNFRYRMTIHMAVFQGKQRMSVWNIFSHKSMIHIRKLNEYIGETVEGFFFGDVSYPSTMISMQETCRSSKVACMEFVWGILSNSTH